ncbi:MAG TPA: I78 family peptidase inhibitor [Devosia sp.]|nr:I78 family peptidase inhibitor [Devosia sp.]
MTLHFLPGIVAFAAVLILTGCTNAAPLSAQLPRPPDCGASLLQEKIGEPVTGSTAADAKVDGVPVRSQGVVRVIAPGQAVTQDYSNARLNLETDADGNLVRATCG